MCYRPPSRRVLPTYTANDTHKGCCFVLPSRASLASQQLICGSTWMSLVCKQSLFTIHIKGDECEYDYLPCKHWQIHSHYLYLRSYPKCSGAKSPGLAADMHFKDDVIAFIGPACAFALEPVARLASYWNTPVITGMGDQVKHLRFNRSSCCK